MADLTEKQKQVLKKHAFPKGVAQNPQGRTSPNKITQEVRYVLAEAAKSNLPHVQQALEKLLKNDDPYLMQRGVELYARILEFSLPKLQANKIETDAGSSAVIVIGNPLALDFNSTNETYDSDDSQILDVEVLPSSEENKNNLNENAMSE
jgi:hypothetical protein